MMNADCLQCDRLILLQWNGAFTRDASMKGETEGGLEKKNKIEDKVSM